MRRSIAMAMLALTLPGCVSFGSDPPPTLFRLTPDRVAPAGTETSGQLANAVIVEDPTADQRIAVMRVPVQVDAANVAYLKDAQWVERPTRQFGALLAETIRARSSRLVFAASESNLPGAMRLSGRLLDMGYDAPSQSVVVRYDAIRTVGSEIATKRFESVVAGVPAEAALIGPALNEAANAVAAQVAEWVG